MQVQVLLLRGINVGGNNILPMAELRTMMKRLGAGQAETYIQSGNVVYSTQEAPDYWRRALADSIAEEKKFRPEIFVLESDQLLAAAERNPYPVTDGKTLMCYFLHTDPPSPDFSRLEDVRAASESFALKGRVFYLHAPEGIGRSKLAALVERELKVPVTARNWNTVSALVRMIVQQQNMEQ